MAGLGDMAKIKNISTRGDISPSEEKYLKLQKEKNCFGICSIYILLLMELMALMSVLQFSDQLEFPGDFLFKKIPWFRRNKTPGYFCGS